MTKDYFIALFSYAVWAVTTAIIATAVLGRRYLHQGRHRDTTGRIARIVHIAYGDGSTREFPLYEIAGAA
jgi:hypothetical protein